MKNSNSLAMTPNQSNTSKITRAVLAAGGLGSKLSPITQTIPKEMLPLGRIPIIEHILQEFISIGITDVLFVINERKEIIRDHFGDGSKWGVNCDFAYQPIKWGPGGAILCSEEWGNGQPFLLAFADNIVQGVRPSQMGPSSALSRLIDTFINNQADFAVLTECIPTAKLTENFLLGPATEAALLQTDPYPFTLRDLTATFEDEPAPYTIIPAARWVMTPKVFDYLRKVKPRDDKEIYLIDIVPDYLAEQGTIWTVPLKQGERRSNLDVWYVYWLEVLRTALKDEEYGETVRLALSQIINERYD